MAVRIPAITQAAARPGLTAEHVGGAFIPNRLSQVQESRKLGLERTRQQNARAAMQNQQLADQIAQEPVIQEIRKKAAAGDKMAQLELTALRPDEAYKIAQMHANMNEQERLIHDQKIKNAGAIALAQWETATPEQKPLLQKTIALAGLWGEFMDLRESTQPKLMQGSPGTQFVDETGKVRHTVPFKPDTQPDKAGFGSGIRAESQNRLIELQQKLARGEQLTSTEEMIAEIAMNNLQQPRTTFKQGPAGENIAITTTPEIPESVKSTFGKKDVQSGMDIKEVTGPKTGKTASNKIIKQMNRAKRTALELAQFIQNNPNTVGLPGQAKKIGGALANIANVALPGDPIPVDTSTKRLERKIILLQSDLRSLIDEGRFSDQDRAKLDDLSNATRWQDSPESAIEMLQDIGTFADQKIMDEGGQAVDPILQRVEEEAKKNGWNEEEKQRAIDLLRSQQNGNS